MDEGAPPAPRSRPVVRVGGGDRRQARREIAFEGGHEFPLVARECDGVLDHLVDVDALAVAAALMRELLEGADDLRDPLEAIDRFGDGAGDFVVEEQHLGVRRHAVAGRQPGAQRGAV